MHGDQHVGVFSVVFLRDRYLVAQLAEDSGPAHSSRAVSGARLFPCGCYKANLHRSKLAQKYDRTSYH